MKLRPGLLASQDYVYGYKHRGLLPVPHYYHVKEISSIPYACNFILKAIATAGRIGRTDSGPCDWAGWSRDGRTEAEHAVDAITSTAAVFCVQGGERVTCS